MGQSEVAEIEAAYQLQDGGCSRPDSLFGFWAIEPQHFQQLVALAKGQDLAALRHEARELKAQAAANGTERPLYSRTGDGIAVIEVRGPMTKYETSFQALLGGASTLRTRQALRAAVRDPDIMGIMVIFDSPGGSVDGTTDLADDIANAAKRKPTYSYAEDLMASAAIFAGVQSRKVYANKAARIGSVGAYAVLYDTSGVYAQDGVKVHVISSAPPHKGAAVDGTEISADQLAEFKRQVMERAAVFIGELATGRRMTREKADSLHTGQLWEASTAKELGLIDGVVSLDEAMRLLRSEAMDEKDLTAAKAKAQELEAQMTVERAERQAAEAKAQELEAQIHKLQADQRRARFAGEAEAFGLPVHMAEVLEKIEAAVGAPIYGKLAESFRAKSEQLASGKLFAETGTTADGGATDESSAWVRIQRLAKDAVKEGKAKSMPAAIALVAKENQDLYTLHLEEQRKGRN